MEENMETRDLEYVMRAHHQYPLTPNKAVRKFDGKTTQAVHPLWCAFTIAVEPYLDEQTREEGALILLYHDVLEDTTLGLPHWLPERVKSGVEMMTFYEGLEQEKREVWNKPPEVRLYKLYDKLSNILDGTWMIKRGQEYRDNYFEYTRQLLNDAEKNYGELNITKMARAILAGGKK